MLYHEMLPYSISSKMREEGWKSYENHVEIPFNIIEEDNYYITLKRKGPHLVYGIKDYNPDAKMKYKLIAARNVFLSIELKGGGGTLAGEYAGKFIYHDDHNIWDLIYGYFPENFKNTDDEVAINKIKGFLQHILDMINQTGYLQILDGADEPEEFKIFIKEQKSIIKHFQSRKHIGKARQRLAKWLKVRFGIILRKNTHDIYILDPENNCYTAVTTDELMVEISKILGPQLINDDDLRWALSYISDRLDPQHNIVKFSNCVFDMNKLEIIDTDKPVFTLVETKYKYNPNACSVVLKDFLESSLHKSTDNETEMVIQGIKEVIGYLFTSGNKLNLLPMITGIAGGGKSVFANILTDIFGNDKIADLKLQEIEKNTHATSSLVNKHLNIIQDSDNSAINNNSLIKQITGNDPLQVNPKHVDSFVLSKEEVPKTIIICNNIPHFKRLEMALIERFLIIEFNVKFRGTNKEDPELLNKILENPEEVEWLIYESITAYKDMIESGEDFILRRSGNITRELVDKHQNPINYLLRKLIKESGNTNDYIIYTNELNDALIELANEEGIDLILNRKGEISKKFLLDAIRYEFELDLYTTSTHNGKRYYPYLIPTKLGEEKICNIGVKDSNNKNPKKIPINS